MGNAEQHQLASKASPVHRIRFLHTEYIYIYMPLVSRDSAAPLYLSVSNPCTSFYIIYIKVIPHNELLFLPRQLLQSKVCIHIRESVDSLCRNGADTQYMYAKLKQKPYNFTKNTPKASEDS